MKSNHFLACILFFIFSFQIYAQNNSLSFDGDNDYVQTNYGGEIKTLEFWFKTNSFDTYDGLFGQRYDNTEESGNWQMHWSHLGSNNQLRIYSYGSGGNGDGKSLITNQIFQTDTWYHVAVTSEEGNLNYYVNGIHDSQHTIMDLVLGGGNNDDNLTIGGSFGNSILYPFDGELDEVRVWSDVRSENEIRQNMYRELPNPIGETNLVAYYKFNETSGTTLVDSKGSNGGTLTSMSGNEWLTSPAMFGPKNALDFDGTNDYISISDFQIISSTITLETWVYFDSFNGGSDANITNLIRGGGEKVCLRIGDGDQPNNKPQFVLDLGSGQQKCNANTNLNANTWYHIACVYNGTEMLLYINGKLDNTVNRSGSVTTTSETFILGSNPDATRALDGQIDEIRIWNDARTATEIRENMCRNLSGNEPNLLAYYNCDNASGTILQDFSGNGYDGTLQNMDNNDWVDGSAFNMWLNTNNSSWSTALNWSRASVPAQESIGIRSYSGGSSPSSNYGTEAGGNHMVVDMSSAWSLAGNLSISGNLISICDINLNGQTISLGSSAYLIEDEGRIYGNSGSISTTRSLSNINENVAGLGAEISTSSNMGSTTITRSHMASSTPRTIERRYDINPSNNSGLNASLTFNYNESELNNNNESLLELSKSTDGGSSWTDQNGSVNTFSNTITLSGINAFSLWTAMESEEVSPPILETDNPVHDYAQNATAIYVAPNTTVTTSTNLEDATVSISPIISGDILSVTNLPAGISHSWDNNTKILSISGTGSATDYQTALRNIKFESSAASEDTRRIDFILGNGIGLMIDGEQHYYEVMDASGNISWSDARANALASRFGLAQGYLATITSATENNYLAEKVSADTWIGASDSEVEGVWKWIDGPETGTQFWLGDLNAGTSSTSNYGEAVNGEYNNWWSSEPNNSYPTYGEDCAHMYGNNSGQPGYWNDYYNGYNVQYYIVEYGGDGSNFTTIDYATIVVNGVSWTGDIDSDWNKAGNWNNNAVPDITTDILIPNVDNEPKVNYGVGADCNNLSIGEGAVLTIESGASLITNGDISNSGTIQIKRNTTKGQWHMVSSPISNGLTEVFAGNYLQYFSEEDDWWYEINETDIALTPMQGYGVWSDGSGTQTYTFTGTPNTGNLSISLTADGSGGTHNRANLIGNPYPSSIDWDEVDYSGAVYLYNGSAYESFTTNKNIAPAQGFFVVPTSSGTFSLTNDCRTHADASVFYKNSNLHETGLILAASNGNYQDKLNINLNESYNENFEQAIDAWKFETNTSGISQIWSICPDGKLSIDSRSPQNIINLGFKNDISGNYSIILTESNEISKAELEDTKLNIFHNLNQGAYDFEWNTTDSEERFILHLEATSTKELLEQEAQVYSNDGQIYIRQTSSQNFNYVQVFDLAGRVVYSSSLGQGELQSISLSNAKGAYLVQLVSYNEAIVQKVVLK